MEKNFYLLEPSFCIENLLKNKKPTSLKKISDFKRSLDKAVSGNYKGLLLPEFYLTQSKSQFYFDSLKQKNLTPVFQIKASHFNNYKQALKNLKQKILLNIIFDDLEVLLSKDFKDFNSQIFFTFILTKKHRKTILKKVLPKWIANQTEIYSPYKQSFLDSFVTSKGLYKFLNRNSNEFKPSSYEIYDSRIAVDIDLEPLTKPFFKNKITTTNNQQPTTNNQQPTTNNQQPTLKFSIIIPSYNYKNQLLQTLRCLAEQDYPKNQFEIIVVDDGSTDNSIDALKKFGESNKDHNVKFFSLPRVIPRKPGDARFRAGIARNLGAKHSESKYLAFLDADILTPPNYLTQLERDHEQADAVLLQRYHLKANADVKKLNFNHEQLKKHIYVEDKNYWANFYKQGFDKQSAPWKYVCTYGFSLLKKDFLQAGRFGKVFLYYGFEDTDLGYRLHKQQKKFFLSDLKVYHQHIPYSRHEHSKNVLSRHKLLCKTGTIFFYKHLDPLIYKELKSFIR